MRRRLVPLIVLAVVAGSCGAEFGLGLPGCEEEVRNPNGAIVLAVEAVPSARYSLCVRGFPLGWDNARFGAERGSASIAISRGIDTTPFLEVEVTESCDVGAARPVPSDNEEIARFESVTIHEPTIRIALIPSSERPRVWSELVAADLASLDIEDRPLAVRVDEDIDHPVSSRVNLAGLHGEFVMIVDDLDVAEETVELRGPGLVTALRGVSVDDALHAIEEVVPDVSYRGSWFFTFDGGCIEYRFDAHGRVAETVAEEAEAALGFYPAYQLVELAGELGYDISAP